MVVPCQQFLMGRSDNKAMRL